MVVHSASWRAAFTANSFWATELGPAGWSEIRPAGVRDDTLLVSAAFQSIWRCSREPRLPPLKVFKGPNPQLTTEAGALVTAVAVPDGPWRTIWRSGFGGSSLVAVAFSRVLPAAVGTALSAVFPAGPGAALSAVFPAGSGAAFFGDCFPAAVGAGCFCCYCCCCFGGDGRGSCVGAGCGCGCGCGCGSCCG